MEDHRKGLEHQTGTVAGRGRCPSLCDTGCKPLCHRMMRIAVTRNHRTAWRRARALPAIGPHSLPTPMRRTKRPRVFRAIHAIHAIHGEHGRPSDGWRPPVGPRGLERSVPGRGRRAEPARSGCRRAGRASLQEQRLPRNLWAAPASGAPAVAGRSHRERSKPVQDLRGSRPSPASDHAHRVLWFDQREPASAMRNTEGSESPAPAGNTVSG
jgi:hypothetical protein